MYNTVGLSQQFAWSLTYNSDNCDVYFTYAEKSLSLIFFSSNTSIFNTEATFKPQTDDWIGFRCLG